MEFTYQAYSNMVEALLKKKYEIVDYSNYYRYKKCVILRHDVDYSIEKAVKFAELEYSLGVQSSYFILISSPFYNIATQNKREQLQTILKCGHKIGLHFDEANYTSEYYHMHGGIRNVILNEVDQMNKLMDIKVEAISMHRPSRQTLEADYQFEGIANSYGNEFFKGFKYISDSRQRWREDVDKIIEFDKYDKLHILTHAFWYNDTVKTIRDNIKTFIDDSKYERYDALEENILSLESLLKKSEI